MSFALQGFEISGLNSKAQTVGIYVMEMFKPDSF